MKGYDKVRKESPSVFNGMTDDQILKIVKGDMRCPHAMGLKSANNINGFTCKGVECDDCSKQTLEADYPEEEGE